MPRYAVACSHDEEAEDLSRLEIASTGNAACPYTRLWIAVIALACQDAVKPMKEGNGFDGKTLKRKARSWLGGGQDFQFVCDMAGIEPETFSAKAKKFIR